MSRCKDGACEYTVPAFKRKYKKSKRAVRYGMLWAEVELSKLLKEV